MATLTIKNIPDELYTQLKQHAIEHRRSINSEVIVCLERSLYAPSINTATTLAKIRRLRKKTNGKLLTSKVLSRAKNKGRL